MTSANSIIYVMVVIVYRSYTLNGNSSNQLRKPAKNHPNKRCTIFLRLKKMTAPMKNRQ